ncbi:hemolysin family protein [Corynebacterium caspium]|uniref:hemolysin family protein n=1 Tax=Corynebacterium caspium TaxID=234828 RepID=UPI0003651A32|nr:hemolysin family protein [Corynebacterium caspium]WKD58896.1 Magnesium and cobalt efflux protein CorC [Corynebacterium caspium DSM 44850]
MDVILFAVIALSTLILGGLVGTVEAALAATSRARVEEILKEERPGASQLLAVLDRRADTTNALVLLHTILDVTAAVFAVTFTFAIFDSRTWAFAVAITGLSLLSFMVVGVFSRTVGRKNPYTVSLKAAVILAAFAKIVGPLARVLIKGGNILAPGQGFRDGPFATEVELREMVDIAQEHGIVELEERRMIQNVFDLGGTTARQVMVPRPDIVWIEADAHAGQATSLCVRSGYSRIPVIGDTMDEIVGVVYLKDLVYRTYHLTDGGRSVGVSEIMRPVVFVPDSKPLDALLHQMQLSRNHIAILIDEYGGVAGMLSMEDILEEIVGEITDEYDTNEDQPIEKIGEHTYRAIARCSLEDIETRINDDLDIDFSFSDEVHDQVDTVAGLVSYALGHVPLPGSEVTISGLHLKTEAGHDRRGRIKVRHVVISVLAAETGESELLNRHLEP